MGAGLKEDPSIFRSAPVSLESGGANQEAVRNACHWRNHPLHFSSCGHSQGMAGL